MLFDKLDENPIIVWLGWKMSYETMMMDNFRTSLMLSLYGGVKKKK